MGCFGEQPAGEILPLKRRRQETTPERDSAVDAVFRGGGERFEYCSGRGVACLLESSHLRGLSRAGARWKATWTTRCAFTRRRTRGISCAAGRLPPKRDGGRRPAAQEIPLVRLRVKAHLVVHVAFHLAPARERPRK